MTNMVQNAKDQAAALAMAAYRAAAGDGSLPQAEVPAAPVEVPRDAHAAPGVAHVHGAGGVGGDELHHDFLALEAVRAAVVRYAFPEDGYQGDDIRELARGFLAKMEDFPGATREEWLAETNSTMIFWPLRLSERP